MPLLPETHLTTDLFDVSGFATLKEKGGVTPINIIHETDKMEVLLEWEQAGFFSQFGAFNGWVYRASVYVQDLGPGADLPITQKDILFKGGPDPQNYSEPIDLPSLPASTYRITVTLNFYDPTFAYSPWHSFEEMGIIEVIKSF
jgi:hypothetical protein